MQSPLVIHSLIVASFAADRKRLESQTASALTQSVCPLKLWNGESPFHSLIVLSADPVSIKTSDAELGQCKNSIAHTAAAWPESVTIGAPSDCHNLAVLSHEPLNKNPGRVIRAQTN